MAQTTAPLRLATEDEQPERMVRFRKVERNDVLAVAGAAVGSFALVWLLFTQLTAARSEEHTSELQSH